MEIPILDTPDPQTGLLLAILGEICQNNRYFDHAWLNQTGNQQSLLETIKDCLENGLFRSNRKCVVKMTIHTLTLTLNLPDILTIITNNRTQFFMILDQLETLPSNRFYSDGVLFMDPKAKPKYSSTLNKWVRTYHLWVDIVKPEFGQIKLSSQFDQNLSTGNYLLQL